MTTTLVALAATVLLTADGENKARPKGDRPDPARIFQMFDKDGDGSLTKDEAPERMKERFDRIDANGDGKVDKEELMAAFRAMGAVGKAGKSAKGVGVRSAGMVSDELFKRWDKNSDGKLSREEAPSFLTRAFDRIDSDNDGSLSKDEMKAARERAAQLSPNVGPIPPDPAPAKDDKPASTEPAKENAKTTSKESAKPAARRPGAPGNPLQAFADADKNNDGKLSSDEAPERMKPFFARVDADGDGFITKEEMRSAFERMRQQGGGAAGTASGPKQTFNEQDADADGRVSAAEAKGVLKEKFDELDANKNGDLDLREVENGLAGR